MNDLEGWSGVNHEIINTIVLIGTGYLLKRLNILKPKDGETISRIIFNVTLPALIIVSLNSVVIEPSIIMLPVIVLLYGIISIFLAYLVFKNEEREMKGTLMMLASGYNVGLFAFPLVEAIWGAEGLLYFGMFDVGNSVVVLVISYLSGSYYSEQGLTMKPADVVKKLANSIPLLTYVLMNTLNFADIRLPSGVIEITEIISRANMPLSLLLLGLYLSFIVEKEHIRPIKKYVLFRYGFGLLFGLLLCFFLPFNDMFRYTILIGFLLPVGLAVIPYAHEFKYKTVVLVGILSNLSILISLIFIFVFSNFIL